MAAPLPAGYLVMDTWSRFINQLINGPPVWNLDVSTEPVILDFVTDDRTRLSLCALPL